MATSGSPKGVEDDLWSKPDETINEKIKDLCPIVITTIDCRPTKFKDVDDNVLTVTSRDGVVLTVIDKDGNERPRSALRNATGGTRNCPSSVAGSDTTTRPRTQPWSTTSRA